MLSKKPQQKVFLRRQPWGHTAGIPPPQQGPMVVSLSDSQEREENPAHLTHLKLPSWQVLKSTKQMSVWGTKSHMCTLGSTCTSVPWYWHREERPDMCQGALCLSFLTSPLQDMELW